MLGSKKNSQTFFLKISFLIFFYLFIDGRLLFHSHYQSYSSLIIVDLFFNFYKFLKHCVYRGEWGGRERRMIFWL